MKKSISFILLLLFVVAIAGAQEKIVLNLQPGKVYTLKQTSISEQIQNVNGMPQEMTITVQQDTDFKIMSLENGIYEVKVIPTSTSTVQKSAMGSMVMDSEGTQTDPMNKIMKNLTDKPINMKMNVYGEILEVDASEYQKGIMDGVELPEIQKMQVEAEMLKSLSNQTLTDSYQTLFNIYPKNEEVAVEDTWENEFKTSVIVTINSTATNELTAVEDKTYTITSKAIMKTEENEKMDFMGIQAVANLKGNMQATYTIDRETGWINEMVQKQKLMGTVVTVPSKDAPEEIKITMDVNNTSKIGQ
jgi:hypothetical protein